MAPIFQPEVPAEAVYWAAHHRRRELWVGHSTVKAILASYLAPIVSRTATSPRPATTPQQIPDVPVPADRPANLFAPVPRLAATHGRFDAAGDARRSPQLWLTMHRATGRRRRRGAAAAVSDAARDLRQPPMSAPAWLNTPHTLREYALLGDGERGAIVGPRGDLVWMCFPHWDSEPLFSALIGGWRHLRGHTAASGTCGAATTSRAA